MVPGWMIWYNRRVPSTLAVIHDESSASRVTTNGLDCARTGGGAGLPAASETDGRKAGAGVAGRARAGVRDTGPVVPTAASFAAGGAAVHRGNSPPTVTISATTAIRGSHVRHALRSGAAGAR